MHIDGPTPETLCCLSGDDFVVLNSVIPILSEICSFRMCKTSLGAYKRPTAKVLNLERCNSCSSSPLISQREHRSRCCSRLVKYRDCARRCVLISHRECCDWLQVNNTDAEGRLTLADALVYASNLKVDKVQRFLHFNRNFTFETLLSKFLCDSNIRQEKSDIGVFCQTLISRKAPPPAPFSIV